MAQNYMTKVRALLDTAESLRDSNPEAAATYQGKAEELMLKYRIEQEELIAKDQFSLEPVLRTIVVCNNGSEYRQRYINLFHYCAIHTGCEVVYEKKRNERGDQVNVVAGVVGYESDVEYAEMLFTASRLVFQARLEPQFDPKLDDQVNVYNLRSAGIERVRIAEMVWGEASKANLSRVGAMYKRECAKRGEQAALSGRGVTGATYRVAYAESFTIEMYYRLARARNAADQAGGGSITLHGRADRVKEAFYTHFPYMRPSKTVATTEEPWECPDCKKAKDGTCRRCAKLERDAQRKAEQRERQRWSAAGVRGSAAGTSAAQQVELDRASNARRLNEASTTPRTTTGQIGG